MRHRLVFAPIAPFFLFVTAAFGLNYSNQEMTNVPSTTCSVPPAVQTFVTGSGTAYLYFDATVAASDNLTNDWLAPDGNVLTGGNWGASSGSFCFTGASLTIDANTPSSRLGTWYARVYDNGSIIFSVPFTITSPGGTPPQPSAPSYTGSFDNVDCAHIYGWAEDQNHPSTTISVDIYVDGSFWATVSAGDYRSDLTTSGIGAHAFNEYSLPSSLTNGQAHTVAVRYSSTSTGLPGSPKAFQNACGVTPTATLSAAWASGSPPQSIVSGQQFSLNWQVAGPSQIQSRVCYGTTSDQSALCQQQTTSWQNSGPASLTANLTAPVVTGTVPHSYYFVIQAEANGQTAYSSVVQSLDTGTSIGPSNVQTWIYDSLQYNQLSGFSIRLDKEHLSDSKYQYRISVTPDNNSIHSLDSAHLILLRPNSVTFDRQNSQILINHDLPQQILSSSAFDWQTPPSPYGGPPHFVQVMLDFIGLLSPEVGTIQGLAELSNDLSSADPTVGPSTWFEGMMNDDNNYHVNRFFIGQQVHLFGSNPTFGIRFAVTEIDESSGQAPQFLVIAKDSSGAIVGAEIGLDRKILASRAQGKAALQYIIVF